MTRNGQPARVRCPGCGRNYEGTPPAYCHTCGTPIGALYPGADQAREEALAQTTTEPAVLAAAVVAPPPAAVAPVAGSKRPRRSRKAVFAVIAVILVALLLLGGGTYALIYHLRDGSKPARLPSTAEELRQSVRVCEEYLTDEGRELAGRRVKGAPIYSVTARLDASANSVSGEETVLFTNRTPDTLKEIVFRVYANSLGVRPKGSEAAVTGTRVDGSQAPTALDNSLLTVTLPKPLAPGNGAVVAFSFEEYIPETEGVLGDLKGLITGESAGGYGVFGRDKDIYNLGYFMPLVTTYKDGAWETREVPPFGDIACFDSAYFNVSLEVPGNFQVAATGLETGSGKSGGRRTCSFAAGPVRDFAAQASAAYQSSTRRVGPTEIVSYYLLDSSDGGRKALEFSANALKQFNKHFGPYPYKRLNVCEAALGGGAAGMEFAGQILLARMLYGATGGVSVPLPDSLKDLGGDRLNDLLKNLTGGIMGDTLEFVVAHEVCHQWWGIVVGSDSIAHPWQDESLTNYSSVLYFRWQHGEDAAKKQLEMQITLPYSAGSLLGGGDGVVDAPVESFKSEHQFTAIVYSKGALFFQALEKRMGEESFEKSLREYYREYAFGNPAPGDLIQVFKDNASDPAAVAALHQRWIREKHADEDIASTLPGGDLLRDLLKNVTPDDMDLGPLEDMFKDFWNDLNPDGGQAPESPFRSTSPVIPI